jgi:hypothetical protein
MSARHLCRDCGLETAEVKKDGVGVKKDGVYYILSQKIFST